MADTWQSSQKNGIFSAHRRWQLPKNESQFIVEYFMWHVMIVNIIHSQTYYYLAKRTMGFGMAHGVPFLTLSINLNFNRFRQNLFGSQQKHTHRS